MIKHMPDGEIKIDRDLLSKEYSREQIDIIQQEVDSMMKRMQKQFEKEIDRLWRMSNEKN